LYKFYGKTEKEIIGKTDFDLMTEKEAVQCRKTDEQALLSTVPLITKEVVMGRYYETMKFPVELPKGEKGIGAYIRDITERKQTEEELKKYRNHLEELVRERTIKLEAANKELEAFSYSASHDLRAPLRTIEGGSQALLEDCGDKLDIQGKDYLIRIRTATRHMAELIEDLLQLSQITRAEMNIENIDLTRIARSVIDELQKSQPQRHVEIRIADGMEETADLKLMRIVLENLLGNAWKFTAKKAQTVIEFGFIKEGGGKVYFIRDNGSGFDMAYADKLFAPFQRLHTEDEFPGTGIGLATVRRIINRHGGTVWTEGQAGKGATFYFCFNEK
jgi:light-regulated signal transduction histidine kinase (bacteriophytochrome)